MKNQRGAALIPLTIASALLVSLSVVTMETVNNSDDVIKKAEQAKVEFAHGEINEQLELNQQVYIIDKYTGKYDKSLINYLKDKNFVNEDGVVQMSTLLGHRENRVPTGKGENETDIYKAEITPQNSIKIMYYDEKGESVEIGELFDDA